MEQKTRYNCSIIVSIINIVIVLISVLGLGFNYAPIISNVIFIFPILIIINISSMYFLKMRLLKKEYSKLFYSSMVYFMFGFLFVGLGVFINTIPTSNFDSQINEFVIDFPVGNASLSNVEYYYDVKNNRGEFKFEIIRWSIGENSVLKLTIPNSLNITELNLTSNKTLLENWSGKEIFRPDVNTPDYLIKLENLTNRRLYFEGRFQGSLLPVSKFSFFSELKPISDWGEEFIFEYTLGDFRCQSPCWGDMINSNPELINNGKVMRIKGKKENFESLNVQFWVNSFNPNEERAQNIADNLWISFMLAGLIFLIEGTISFVHSLMEIKRQLR